MTGDNFPQKHIKKWQIKECEDGLKRIKLIPYIVTLIVMVILFVMWINKTAQAQNIPCPAMINLAVIAKIESNNNSLAYNAKSGARGMYQITLICLQDYNQFHPTSKMPLNALFSPYKARIVAEWYLMDRIPNLLKKAEIKVNQRNIIITYNAGIKWAKKAQKGYKLPKETQNYIKKYVKLSKACQ